jgi:hypothetical protein
MNWRIHLSPCVALPDADTTLSLSVAGAVITINGDDLDLTSLGVGDTLPASAVDHPLIERDIRRTLDGIEITFVLMLGPGAPEEARFPAPIIMTTDGPVPLPPTVVP